MTVPSVWDDAERGYALELDEYESDVCGCGCGLLREESHNDKQAYLIEEDTCYAARQVEKHKRTKRAEAEKANRPEGWDDGIHYFARPISDDEVQRIQAEHAEKRATRGRRP